MQRQAWRSKQIWEGGIDVIVQCTFMKIRPEVCECNLILINEKSYFVGGCESVTVCTLKL